MRRMMGAMILVAAQTSVAWADNLDKFDKSATQAMAKVMTAAAESMDKPPVKIDADLENATGVHGKGASSALLLVPQKKIDLDDKRSDSDPGIPAGHLFLAKGVEVVVNGKAVEPGKLRTLKTQGSGDFAGELYYLGLALRHTNDDIWHLFAYGADGKPVIDMQIEESASTNPDISQTLDLEVKDVQDGAGTAKISIFGENECFFKVRLKP